VSNEQMMGSPAPLGDSAVTIRLGTEIDRALARRVRDLAERVRAAEIPWVREVVGAYAALTVWYDPLRTDYASVVGALTPIVQAEQAAATEGSAVRRTPRERVVPVVYDGPDLEEVARRTGLDRSAVIERHSNRWYDVYFVGFVPGWGYLGDLDPALVLPRRDEPRPRVPAGSVAIAGTQTGVYPLVTPGGWHLIGWTPTVFFDPKSDPPALLAAGDRVRFEPVTG
jgi:inhibitor of KinA